MVRKKKKSGMAARARERAAERQKERESGSGWNRAYSLPEDVELFEVPVPKKGTTTKLNIRIVPFTAATDHNLEGVQKGEQWYRVIMLVHKNIGPEERVYLCPKTFGEKEKCPICDEHRRLKRDPDATDEEVRACKPQERQLYNVLDLDDEKAGVQLWDVSSYLFGNQVEDAVNEQDDEIFYAEQEDGCALYVTLKKKKLGKNPFMETVDVEFGEPEPLDDDIVEQAIALDSLLIKTDAKTLKAEFEGEADEEEDEDEEEERPSKHRRRKKTSEPEEDEDDKEDEEEEEAEDEEDEEAEDEEDEEEEKPRRGRRRRHKKTPEPEEEEEEDEAEEEEEEEEEEKPRRGRRRRKKTPESEEEDEDDEDLEDLDLDDDEDFADPDSEEEEEEEKPRRRRRRRRK